MHHITTDSFQNDYFSVNIDLWLLKFGIVKIGFFADDIFRTRLQRMSHQKKFTKKIGVDLSRRSIGKLIRSFAPLREGVDKKFRLRIQWNETNPEDASTFSAYGTVTVCSTSKDITERIFDVVQKTYHDLEFNEEYPMPFF